MKALLSTFLGLFVFAMTWPPHDAAAQYQTSEDFRVAWSLSAHENPDIFDRGPAFGTRSVLTNMDFDGDGNKEFLFTTDETISAQGAGTGHIDVFLYESAGNDEFEYVWSYTHPDSSNSLPALNFGDVDEDGLWEIYLGIPTIDDENKLFIFEQNGDGTFPAEPTLTYNYERTPEDDFRPTSFAIGDFDGDGVQELATTSRTSGAREMVVVEPVGSIDAFGSFAIEFEAGEADLGGGAVYEVDAVDYDDDGQMELWVNTWNNFSWTIYEATGEDTYEKQADIDEAFVDDDPFSFNTNKTLFFDADGDGRLEHLAAMSSNGKLYYMDDTDDVSTITASSWTEVGQFDLLGRTRGADIGDLDGDGRFDIVASGGTAETVARIEYNGAGDPADSTSYTWSTLLDSRGGSVERYYPLRIADDLDGDGFNEVVVTNLYADDAGQDMIVIVEYSGPTQYIPANDMRISWMLDPREHPDVFERGPAFGARSVLTDMDFDGDGNKEFLFTTDETISDLGVGTGHIDVFLYESAGNDEFEYVWSYTHPDSSNSLPALNFGDVDEDGLWEIYLGIPTIDDENKLFIFEQNGDGTFPAEPTLTYNYERTPADDFRPTSFAIGDFDGDGVQELATTSRTSGAREMVVVEPVGGIDAFGSFAIEFEAGEADLGGGAVYEVDAVDYDDDGQTELWVNTWNNFSWTIYEATGEDTYEKQADIDEAFVDDDPFSFNTNKTLFFDADGDGRLEHIAAMSSNGKLYYMDDTDDVSTITASSWTEVGQFDLLGRTRGADIGDLDGDGRFDIVASGGTAETVARIEYNGAGDPADSTSYTWSTLLDSRGGAVERYYPLRIADDLDGDGFNEVVIPNLFAGEAGTPLIVIMESSVVTDVEQGPEVPQQFTLRQNYPNPFNPTTTIQYELKTTAPVTVRVFDSMGRLVSTLVNDQMHTAGVYEVQWDGRSAAGQPVASGVYFYTLETRDFRTSRQMVLVK